MTEPAHDEDSELDGSEVPLTTDPDQLEDDLDPTTGEGGAG